MLKQIDAVIFDMDGTLIDSMWMWKDIDIEYLGRYGIKLPGDLQKKIEGMSFSETAVFFKEHFNIPDSVDKIKDDWNQMAWDKYENEVPVKEGVFDFLRYLRKQKIKTGIATSNSLELTELVLKKRDLFSYFDEIHTSCEVGKGKPAPDIYLFVAKKLAVRQQNCLVFEDVVPGIIAGKSAGMKVCAIYDEFSKAVEEEKKKLSDYYISSFHDLKQYYE
ncbi:HAD family hydrolase [Anaeromicropila populeti]|uniref:Haloacid dehalogenase superfamily, subfamily IA, variant 3 with third motif having DD or ED/haloacid dehalogenase superfamily, subfamily IA, variant 1 with third motif having Dx(3-4)D or Dx(3-4)E n=1 Tax=Anaeromicropila populeti TaxID=37658 RepID=A0A1I6KY20_9FIRM|nr:HAD family phosphatase [Anaeromicropila populeti]SFR96104.1 haloacid dehalogenase superfamily, subfamily IA, variant 3 with third motif having DD or ED/haloacid dehalogenase superfamily, subfamily IA, variant 1 with third motif having Dx(3-4)D or Dx(3-4)E [Anaeromicropila populeti]